MGVCAGGDFSIAAATTDRRIKAVAGVSTTEAGSAMRDGWDGTTPVSEQFKLLEAASAQRTAEANEQPVACGGYVPDKVDRSLLPPAEAAHSAGLGKPGPRVIGTPGRMPPACRIIAEIPSAMH